MEKNPTSDLETAKQDLKVLKSYTRKIAIQNKLIVKMIEPALDWIQSEKGERERRVDLENLTEDNVKEFIESFHGLTFEWTQRLQECVKLQVLYKEQQEILNSRTHLLEEQNVMINQLKDEIMDSSLKIGEFLSNEI
jgi:hypothetical protein